MYMLAKSLQQVKTSRQKYTHTPCNKQCMRGALHGRNADCNFGGLDTAQNASRITSRPAMPANQHTSQPCPSTHQPCSQSSSWPTNQPYSQPCQPVMLYKCRFTHCSKRSQSLPHTQRLPPPGRYSAVTQSATMQCVCVCCYSVRGVNETRETCGGMPPVASPLQARNTTLCACVPQPSCAATPACVCL